MNYPANLNIGLAERHPVKALKLTFGEANAIQFAECLFIRVLSVDGNLRITAFSMDQFHKKERHGAKVIAVLGEHGGQVGGIIAADSLHGPDPAQGHVHRHGQAPVECLAPE